MIALLFLALTSFAQVFTLGFQSRSVNAGNYGVAFVCSTLIGFSQVYVWKHVIADTSSPVSATVYSLSGACAICCAIFVHQKFFPKKV